MARHKQNLLATLGCLKSCPSNLYTLQGTNISRIEKRKLIFNSALVRDMLGPWRVPTSPLIDLEMYSACRCFSQHLAFVVG